MNTVTIIAVIVVTVAAYAAIMFLLPKKGAAGSTSFTKKQLKGLEEEDLGLLYQMENEFTNDRRQSKSFLAKLYYAFPLGEYSHIYLLRGGMAGAVDQLFLTCVAVFVVALGLIPWFGITRNVIFVVVGALIAAYVAAWFIIRMRIRKRLSTFFDQFPDALDIIVRSVKSGFPLNAAVNMVAESMPNPASEEFKKMSNEVLHGSTMVDALSRLGERMQTPDIRFFVVVLTLQQEVGGSLAEVLSNLSSLIRKRKIMAKKVRAITAEGRLTGWILGALPLIVFLVIQMLEPNYMMPLYTTPSGHMVLGIAVAVVVAGIMIIRKMVDLEI